MLASIPVSFGYSSRNDPVWKERTVRDGDLHDTLEGKGQSNDSVTVMDTTTRTEGIATVIDLEGAELTDSPAVQDREPTTADGLLDALEHHGLRLGVGDPVGCHSASAQ